MVSLKGKKGEQIDWTKQIIYSTIALAQLAKKTKCVQIDTSYNCYPLVPCKIFRGFAHLKMALQWGSKM